MRSSSLCWGAAAAAAAAMVVFDADRRWLAAVQADGGAWSSVAPSILSLMAAVRAADERTLLSQLESFLHLFQLREMLQSVEAAADSEQLKSHTRPHSSLFRSFLEWTYGKEEADTRNAQLQRLAHWFHWKRETDFYQRLLHTCEDERSISSSSSRNAAAATEAAPLSRRRTPITISYFYELSPRLPALLASSSSDAGGGESARVEARLRSYLALRPISQLRSALANDFAGFQRLASEPQVDQSAAPLLQSAAAAGDGSFAYHNVPPALQLPISMLADAAAADSGARRQTPEDALRVLRYELPVTRVGPRMQSLVEVDPIVREMDEDARSEVRLDPESEPEGEVSREDMAEEAEEEDDDVEEDEEDCASAPPSQVSKAQQRARRSKKRTFNETAPTVVIREPTTSPQQPPPVLIPCLGASEYVPIELVRLGLTAWERQRKSANVDALHRHAMDEMLADLVWDLADQLPDGAKLELRDFKQARRSESRDVAAAHSTVMEGERRCATLRSILDMLTTCETAKLAAAAAAAAAATTAAATTAPANGTRKNKRL